MQDVLDLAYCMAVWHISIPTRYTEGICTGQAKQITVKPRPFRARWRHPSLGVSYLIKVNVKVSIIHRY